VTDHYLAGHFTNGIWPVPGCAECAQALAEKDRPSSAPDDPDELAARLPAADS
jgi:hypothetical protein